LREADGEEEEEEEGDGGERRHLRRGGGGGLLAVRRPRPHSRCGRRSGWIGLLGSRQ
jgi:hypothetical protein